MTDAEFARVYEQYHPVLLESARKRLKNRVHAQDLVQTVFEDLYSTGVVSTFEIRPGEAGEAQLRAWLFIAMRYRFLRTLRGARVRHRLDQQYQRAVARTVDPKNTSEVEQDVTAAIHALGNPVYQQIAYLRLMRDASFDDIESVVGVRHVRKLWERKIRPALRSQLHAYGICISTDFSPGRNCS